ncbi:hypothetical protein CDAR_89731 [Caerostris darwini]|uniref:Uncharacterized protein n=1 Tax=Caerostris darwini TaxID=1538125 RepID=A0AAV4RRL7_9ARAC|nr:hypothetical protein CDAR_89731 [Caerostris darwini]
MSCRVRKYFPTRQRPSGKIRNCWCKRVKIDSEYLSLPLQDGEFRYYLPCIDPLLPQDYLNIWEPPIPRSSILWDIASKDAKSTPSHYQETSDLAESSPKQRPHPSGPSVRFRQTQRRVPLIADCLTVDEVFRGREDLTIKSWKREAGSSGMQLEEALKDNCLKRRLEMGILNLKYLGRPLELTML